MKYIKFENVENLKNIVENFEEIKELFTFNKDGSVCISENDLNNCVQVDNYEVSDDIIYNDFEDVMHDVAINFNGALVVNLYKSLPDDYYNYKHYLINLAANVIECYTTLTDLLTTNVDGVEIVEVDDEN